MSRNLRRIYTKKQFNNIFNFCHSRFNSICHPSCYFTNGISCVFLFFVYVKNLYSRNVNVCIILFQVVARYVHHVWWFYQINIDVLLLQKRLIKIIKANLKGNGNISLQEELELDNVKIQYYDEKKKKLTTFHYGTVHKFWKKKTK